ANALGGAQGKLYPTGNDFPSMAQWQTDFVNIGAADYRLTSTSLSKGSATDGTDIGVNFATLNAAMNGSAAAPAPPPTPTSNGLLTVQFEAYDGGGEGVGYHDTTSGNSGGVYRSNNVDIQATTDAGGGYNIAWV